MNVIEFIGTGVTSLTAAYVVPVSTSLMVPMAALALVLATLWIMFVGFGMAFGIVEAPFGKFMAQAGKILLISGIGLTAAGYGKYVIDVFNGFQFEMISVVTRGDGLTTYDVLDQILNKAIDVAAICQQNSVDAGWLNPVPRVLWFLCQLAVLIGISVIVLVGGGAIIMSQFLIAILLTVGPLYIVALIVPQTARFFNGWFSYMMNCIFVIIFVSIVMSFSVALFDSFISQIDVSGDGEGDSPMWVLIGVGVLSGFLVMLIYQTKGMAAALSGGLSLSPLTLSHMGAYARGANNVVNPMSTRLDSNTGMQARASRIDHILTGNTVMNPNYRSALRTNFARNWGRSQGGNVRNSP